MYVRSIQVWTRVEQFDPVELEAFTGGASQATHC
jgi:hypothetical protein